MMNKDDLIYLSNNLANLSGLPVRLYQNEEKIYYYSTIDLVKDPFIVDEKDALSKKEHVSHFINEFGFFYGIVSYQETKIIIGPTSEVDLPLQNIKNLAFKLDIHPSEVEEFISSIKALVKYPLLTILEMLCTINFALSGEKESVANITIHKDKQESIIQEIEEAKIDSEKDIDIDKNSTYIALDIENYIIDIVMRGDVGALNAYLEKMPSVRSGVVAQDYIRQAKNIFIVSTTLVSRAAIRGGIDVTKALRLSDIYIQKCETMENINEITELNYQMLLDYTKKVEAIRFKETTSKLVIDVTRYIQDHISEAIKVEDISKSIYLSRSRLSTAFKKETGINLCDYIYIIKLNEAKRLLRYSNRSLSSIALYLGFSSQSHFTKIFKEKTGSTPYEYKQKHRRNF